MRLVIAAQECLIELEAVGVVGRAVTQNIEPARLRRRDGVAQLRRREGAGAIEADAQHLADVRLLDLEGDVDAVLRQRCRLGGDDRRDPALLLVEVADTLHVGIGARGGIDAADLQLHHIFELRRVDGLVTLVGHLIDGRVLDDGDEHAVPAPVDAHVAEITGGHERTHGPITRRLIEPLPRRQLQHRGDALDRRAVITRDLDGRRGRSGKRGPRRSGQRQRSGHRGDDGNQSMRAQP